jgi:asparagine synthase (glutamine-hydrolysing)
MVDVMTAGRNRDLPWWFVRVGGPDWPDPEGKSVPTVRLTAPFGDGAPTVTIDVWAQDPDYRLSTAEAKGCAAVVIRHPFCHCGGTGSEAERFLWSFEQRPDDVFDKLRGEAVLIIWDGAGRRLQAAKTPGSTRPLFFAEAGDGLALSDSIDALHRRGRIDLKINRELLVCHLADSWHGSDETYYLDVRRVPPAHALRWRNGEASFSQFWDPLPVGQPIDWIECEVPEQFDALFEQAVARSVGVGRPGIFLSGGLDSVSVAAVAADLVRSNGGSPPLALSLAMPHPECDERETQEGVAVGLQLEQVFLGFDEALAGRDFVEAALELAAGWPAPLHNFWLPAYLRLAEIGRERGCGVILTGHGGDEWLGVSPYLSADQLRRLQLMQWIRLWRAYDRSYRLSRPRLLFNHVWTFGLRPLMSSAVWDGIGTFAPDARRQWRRWRHRRSLPGWLAPDLDLRRALMQREEAAWEAQDTQPSEDEYLRQCRLPISHALVALEQDEIAEQGRRTGTLLRQPFFDPELVAFLSRVRPEQLARGGRSKGLVRDEVARRCPDLGFESQRKVLGGSLFRERMQRGSRSMWRRLGGPRVLGEMGVVDVNEVQFMLERFEGGTTDARATHRVWSLLSLEVWARARQSMPR